MRKPNNIKIDSVNFLLSLDNPNDLRNLAVSEKVRALRYLRDDVNIDLRKKLTPREKKSISAKMNSYIKLRKKLEDNGFPVKSITPRSKRTRKIYAKVAGYNADHYRIVFAPIENPKEKIRIRGNQLVRTVPLADYSEEQFFFNEMELITAYESGKLEQLIKSKLSRKRFTSLKLKFGANLSDDTYLDVPAMVGAINQLFESGQSGQNPEEFITGFRLIRDTRPAPSQIEFEKLRKQFRKKNRARLKEKRKK